MRMWWDLCVAAHSDTRKYGNVSKIACCHRILVDSATSIRACHRVLELESSFGSESKVSCDLATGTLDTGRDST